jgi:hypothetical protein
MRRVGIGLVMAIAFTAFGASAGIAAAPRRMQVVPHLQCSGASLAVPTGWHGRLRGTRELFTLTAATSRLVPEGDDFDELSSRKMAGSDVLILVIGYGGDAVDGSAFRQSVSLPLRVERMQVLRLFEGMADGHRMARVLFFARGAAYDVRVQFGGPVTKRASARADAALRGLRFTRPGAAHPC